MLRISSEFKRINLLSQTKQAHKNKTFSIFISFFLYFYFPKIFDHKSKMNKKKRTHKFYVREIMIIPVCIINLINIYINSLVN